MNDFAAQSLEKKLKQKLIDAGTRYNNNNSGGVNPLSFPSFELFFLAAVFGPLGGSEFRSVDFSQCLAGFFPGRGVVHLIPPIARRVVQFQKATTGRANDVDQVL